MDRAGQKQSKNIWINSLGPPVGELWAISAEMFISADIRILSIPKDLELRNCRLASKRFTGLESELEMCAEVGAPASA